MLLWRSQHQGEDIFLLGWYQSQPSDTSRPGPPRRWILLHGATITSRRHPPDACHQGPQHLVEIQETAEVAASKEDREATQTPLVVFGSEMKALVDEWTRELLVASRMATSILPSSWASWSSRKGGVVSESAVNDMARAAVRAGSYVAETGRCAGAVAEQSFAHAGSWVGTKAAPLLTSDEEAAERFFERCGRNLGSMVNLGCQVPGALLRLLGSSAGGAQRPHFTALCEGRERESLCSGEESAELVGQLMTCDGCCSAPVADEGCRLCKLRLCALCFEMHVKPADIRPADDLRLFRQSSRQEQNAVDQASRQREQDDLRRHHLLLAESRLALSASVQGFSRSVPRKWRTHHNCPEEGCPDWKFTAVRDEVLLKGLQACLATNSDVLQMRGRDDPAPKDHSGFKLACAWQVEHHRLWSQYQAAAQGVSAEVQAAPKGVGRGPVLKMRNESSRDEPAQAGHCDWSVALGCPLKDSINEKILCHGVAPANVTKVLHGFSERFCSRTSKFGQGCYLAEDCGKADQYTCGADGSSLDSRFGDHVDLHRLLFGTKTPNLNPHPGDLHYVFFCRAVLGHAARTEDGRTELSTGKNLFAEASGQRELAAIEGSTLPYHSLLVETGGAVKRYREIVLFHGERIYPEFLVAYQRV